MKKDCITSQGFDDKSQKFFVNINKKNGITDSKEMFKNCVQCQDFIECKKQEIFFILLEKNQNA